MQGSRVVRVLELRALGVKGLDRALGLLGLLGFRAAGV